MRAALFIALLSAATAARAGCPCEASRPCMDEAFALAPQQVPAPIPDFEPMELTCADCGAGIAGILPIVFFALFLLPITIAVKRAMVGEPLLIARLDRLSGAVEPAPATEQAEVTPSVRLRPAVVLC